MQNILNLQLREKAGSDSYNRFEYQAHWILYHMLDNIQNKKTFLVFCEFHDDMAESEYGPSATGMNFYQVKTTDTKERWTLSSLFKNQKEKMVVIKTLSSDLFFITLINSLKSVAVVILFLMRTLMMKSYNGNQ